MHVIFVKSLVKSQWTYRFLQFIRRSPRNSNLFVFKFNCDGIVTARDTIYCTHKLCDFFGQQTRTRWNRIRQAIPPRKRNAANFFDGSKRSPIFLLAFDVSIIGVDSNGARSGPPPPLSSLKFICQRFTAPSFSPDDSDFSAATWRGSRLSSPAQWARRTDD